GRLLSAKVRQSAQDRQTEIARYLLGISHARVNAIKEDRAHYAQSQPSQQSHQEDSRRRILHGTLGHDCRIEDADVRNGVLRSEPGLIEALLESRVCLFLQLHVAIQTSLFNRSGGGLAQIARRRVTVSAELRFSCSQLRRERARERGDRSMLEPR